MLTGHETTQRDLEADASPGRRINGRLRRHIDCLLEAGARITGRSPTILVFEGRTLTVRNDQLFNETGLRDLITAVASHVWPSPHLRNVAIDICIGQLDQAIGAWGTQTAESNAQTTQHDLA